MKKTLKIVVLAKQVPDTRNVGKDAMKADGTVKRAALPTIFNPEDLNALEQALVLKDMFPGSTVEILTMGPGRAAEIIREGMYRGADGGVLLSDRKFAGSDTLATSYALSRAILNMKPDIIVAGRQAIDGDTAQVGSQIAEKLGVPQVTYVKEFKLEADEILVKRALEDGYELLKLRPPCVLTAIKELNTPRYMSIRGILKGAKADIRVWSAEDIGVDQDTVGLKASPTNVFRSFTPKPKGKGVTVAGDTAKELAENLIKGLKEKHII